MALMGYLHMLPIYVLRNKKLKVRGCHIQETNAQNIVNYLLLFYFYDMVINVMLIYRQILWLKVATTPF